MHPAVAADTTPNPAIIFDILLAHQRSAATLARRCSTSQRGMRILCDFLTIIGLLVKRDGIYSHSPTSALFLDPRSPASLHSMARFMGLAEMTAAYNQLTEVVRSGRTLLPGEGSVE